METAQPLPARIMRSVRARGKGAIVVTNDFVHMANRAAVDQALSRLAKAGRLRRLARGVYDYPRVNERMGIVVTPSADDVVQAIARSEAIRVQEGGALAANRLGLSTQVPARLLYLTDGASRTLNIHGQLVELRHAPPRAFANTGSLSSLVIEALKYLRKDNVSPDVVHHLKENMTPDALRQLQSDAKYAPVWIQKIVSGLANTIER